MPTQVLLEPVRAGEHLVSEVTTQSREVGVITGGNYRAGTVLGKITTSGKLTILAPAAADGSQNASAILYAPTDASAGDVRATINVRLTEVNGLILTWPAGITGPQQAAAITALAAQGVIVRT